MFRGLRRSFTQFGWEDLTNTFITHIIFNSFETASECEQVTCPISNKRYFERGCRPDYKGKACCPTSFSCRKLSYVYCFYWKLIINSKCLTADDKSAKGVCHYGEMTFELGQQVPAVTEDQPCKTYCYCVSSVEQWVTWVQSTITSLINRVISL